MIEFAQPKYGYKLSHVQVSTSTNAHKINYLHTPTTTSI